MSDITLQRFTLIPDPDKPEYGSFWMYVSEEKADGNLRVINGVYIRKEYLSKPPPQRLIVSFEEA